MSEMDLFKEDFKNLKKKFPRPDFNHVIDFETNSSTDIISRQNEILQSSLGENSCILCEELGLRSHRLWDVHLLKGFDGFLHVKNPFTHAGQQLWIQKCLEVYPRKPSVTNLDLHYFDVDDIWSLRNSDDPIERSYLYKLCWSTLGYHHNWDTKVYDPNHKSDFPECLKKLSQHIASCLGFENYEPEAAIVNYYSMKSSLGIHNDHSEENLDAPIISFSFGQTGIFLIGTQNRTDKPAAVFLRSGDIIVMSGSSRLAYHAVPCIIPEDIHLRCSRSEDSWWLPFNEYISKARVNISVRQVYMNKR